MMNLDDTIVAIATPPGRGGIGVVRLAGPEARAIVEPMLRRSRELEPNRAIRCDLIEPADTTKTHVGTAALGCPAERSSASADATTMPPPPTRIDEVVVTYFAKPHSYTTDDIIEISAHGSPVVLRHIVELSLARGARLAEPGEFTMRAFLNGRLDLTQAEAVRDLIDAQTLFQAKVAAQQLDGALSNRLKPIKQKLVDLIALLEAGIDFAEDDVSDRLRRYHPRSHRRSRKPAPPTSRHFCLRQDRSPGTNPSHSRSSERGQVEPLQSPGRTRTRHRHRPARHHPRPGQRNRSHRWNSCGTGGHRRHPPSPRRCRSRNPRHQEIHRSPGRRRPSPGSNRQEPAPKRGRRGITTPGRSPPSDSSGKQIRPARRVEGQQCPRRDSRPRLSSRAKLGNAAPIIQTSALTGEGIPALREAILRHVAGDRTTQQESGFLTNVRHQKLVNDTLASLDDATNAVATRVPHEMLLLDLYRALRPLDEITGATTTDDILNLIFGTFCIGK